MNAKQTKAAPFRLEGLIPPMVTPLAPGRTLDVAGVKNMVRHLLGGGVDGIFLLGTTGEAQHLSYAVRKRLVETVCRLVKGRVPVIVGITETNMDGAVEFASACKAVGASAAVAAPPYYFKLTQDECVDWFSEMAARIPVPLVVYNMPAHTDTVLAPETIARLADRPNIVGLKDSSANIALFNKIRIALENKDFAVFMGPDEAMGEAVLVGAAGGVCSGANLWPAAFKQMYLAAKAGNVARVRELQRFTALSAGLFYGIGQGQGGFLRGIKCALSEMGLVQNVLSSPFRPFEGRERAKVKAALGKMRALARALGIPVA